jgi:hypothetical protein
MLYARGGCQKEDSICPFSTGSCFNDESLNEKSPHMFFKNAHKGEFASGKTSAILLSLITKTRD